MTDALTTAIDTLTTSLDTLSTTIDTAVTALATDPTAEGEVTADAATISALQAQVDTLTAKLAAALGTSSSSTVVVSAIPAQTAPLNSPFSLDLTSDISGGAAPYTLSAPSGLPIGLSISGLVISGTPTTALAQTAVPLVVTDSSTPPQTADVSVDFTVA